MLCLFYKIISFSVLILVSFYSLPILADTNILYVHADHLGTPKQLTDSNQVKVWQAHHAPFGKAIVESDTNLDGIPTELNIRFPGQYYDEETGLHYNWHRYYSPELGRYISSDPIGLQGGMNTYGYALQNPVQNIDFYGLDTTVITIRRFGIGIHSAAHVDNGPNNQPLLYDPAGDFRKGARPSGEAFSGEFASLEAYIKFQEGKGATVETTTIPTTPSQEKVIADRAISNGGAPIGGLCTLLTSAAISAACNNDLEIFPGELAKAAKGLQCE